MKTWGHNRSHEFRTVTRPAGCYTYPEAAERNEFSATTLSDRVDSVCFRRDHNSLTAEDVLLLSCIVQDNDGMIYFERVGFDRWSDSYMAREDVQKARSRRIVVAPNRRDLPTTLRSELDAVRMYKIHSRNGQLDVWFLRPLD